MGTEESWHRGNEDQYEEGVLWTPPPRLDSCRNWCVCLCAPCLGGLMRPQSEGLRKGREGIFASVLSCLGVDETGVSPVQCLLAGVVDTG